MANETFNDNLLRLVAAQLHFLSGLTASREMFGRGYFSLGHAEKLAVDQIVNATIASNYQTITPEFLAGQATPQAMGFPTRAAEQP